MESVTLIWFHNSLGEQGTIIGITMFGTTWNLFLTAEKNHPFRKSIKNYYTRIDIVDVYWGHHNTLHLL